MTNWWKRNGFFVVFFGMAWGAIYGAWAVLLPSIHDCEWHTAAKAGMVFLSVTLAFMTGGGWLCRLLDGELEEGNDSERDPRADYPAFPETGARRRL